MKILFIGDIVGKPGRDAIVALLPGLVTELRLDFVIANAENASGGSGITQKSAEEMFAAGVHVLTSGDHIWKKKEILDYIATERRVLRPLNYPAGAPGSGMGVFTATNGASVAVINVNGRVFMDPIEHPFHCADAALAQVSANAKVIIVDIHAEATSEKVALGWYLDGRVSAVIGTHTHIQTADEKILPKGTGYLTDAGMTGPYDSVIGRNVDDVLQRFLTGLPARFEVAQDNIQLHGVVVTVDERNGKARVMERIQRKYVPSGYR
jgi:hypothetical protein